MNRITGICLLLCFHAGFCILGHAGMAEAQSSSAIAGTPHIAEWNAPRVEHAYGLPETKVHDKGTLTINSGVLTFTGKSGSYSIPRSALLAVSTGSERVELWGMKGRILRMAIPNGGGLAAAGVMHHKVNMLSIEFRDPRDGYHAAVFYLPAEEAERVMSSFADLPPAQTENSELTLATPSPTCINDSPGPRNILVTMPVWNQTDVPAAYRALLYEHTVNRLQRLDGIGHVYREGEAFAQKSCPDYVIHMSVTAFQLGSQVKRAMMGPVGFFVGTTQMTFNVEIKDATGRLNVTDELKTTVRGESESKNVADSVAKLISKRYVSETKRFEKSRENSQGNARL
jgi:hypothetical protein